MISSSKEVNVSRRGDPKTLIIKDYLCIEQPFEAPVLNLSGWEFVAAAIEHDSFEAYRTGDRLVLVRSFHGDCLCPHCRKIQ